MASLTYTAVVINILPMRFPVKPGTGRIPVKVEYEKSSTSTTNPSSRNL